MPSKFFTIGLFLIAFLYVVALTLDSLSNAEMPKQKSSQQYLDEMYARQVIKKLLQD